MSVASSASFSLRSALLPTVLIAGHAWPMNGSSTTREVIGMPDEQELENILESNMTEDDEFLLWEQHEMDEVVE